MYGRKHRYSGRALGGNSHETSPKPVCNQGKVLGKLNHNEIHQFQGNRVAHIDIPTSFSTNSDKEGKGVGNLHRQGSRMGFRQTSWDVSTSKARDPNLHQDGARNSIILGHVDVTYFSLAMCPIP